MATEKQIAANRRNAQKSTGPKTAEGKYKVRFNAVKHGMTASAAVLPFEDANSYDELRQALMDDYHPANSREHMLVEMIAVNYWRLLRARRVEVASFDLNIQTVKRRNGMSQVSSPDDDSALAVAFVNEQNVFRNIERYTEATERAYYRAIDTLRRLQNDREKREKVGFVSPPQPRAQVVAASDTKRDPTPVNVFAVKHSFPSPQSVRTPEPLAFRPGQPTPIQDSMPVHQA